ncbi:MAG: peptidoglycan DD-metalloendopeptidase family protein [Sphingomonas sp.]
MYLRHETGLAGGGGATPGFGQAPPFRARDPAPAAPRDWRRRLADLDLVVDLGAGIGSARWWRGLATCMLLCGGAIATAPGVIPLPGATPAAMPEAHWREARALGIAPLALGSDTGRRMAATEAVEPLVDAPERPRIDLAATIGQGDGFARVLERAGVAAAQAQAVARQIAAITPLDRIRPGTRIALTLGRRASRAQARPLDGFSLRAAIDLRLDATRTNGALIVRPTRIAVDDTPLRITGRVGTSLYAAARAAGAPAEAVVAYIRALSARMPIGAVRDGDRFDLILSQRRSAGGEVETGDLLYAGLDQGGRQTRLLRWTTGGRTQFFEASGVGEQRGAMTQPVTGRMTSGFGMRRHPQLGFSRFHRGVDFGAAYGAPVVAATTGVIGYAGWHGGHGKYVMIRHGGGMATAYGHMSRIIAQAGARVTQGELIGYVGSTGLSTGPHLHYEVWRNGVAIDPASVRFTTTSQLVGADLAAFRATLARVLAVRPGAAARPSLTP